MIYVTRRVDFCASHRLFNPNYSDKKNETIYGNCSNLNGHGHNYILNVTIKGDIDPETGMVIELNALKKLIKTEVSDYLDHKNLNIDVGFLENINPTVENLAGWFFHQLHVRFVDEYENNLTLNTVELFETPTCKAICNGLED